MDGKIASKLYSKGKIGKLELRNRFVMTAMHTAYNTDGVVSDEMVEFYRRRAKGGAGLIIVGASGVDPLRLNHHGMLRLSDDIYIPGLKRLTEAIHAEGGLIFPQLMHPGRYARSKEYDGLQAVAPSEVSSRFTGETPRELTIEEIEQIVSFFGEAAGRAKEAGFDGVEITAASGYLLAQFLSPMTNKRTDIYGGDLEGRLTFPLAVIAAVRKAVGQEYPVMIRVAGNDFMPGGNTWVETVQVCRAFEKAGADAIDVTGGWHETAVPQLTMEVPYGAFAYLGRKIKESVSIPVVMCNRMTPVVAERVIDDGWADFAGFARGFLAEPNLAVKAIKGDYAGIRPCVACNQACMDHIFFGKQLNCLVNAEAGRETDLMKNSLLPTETLSLKPQKILVVGAGVAGLEYSRVAALRGHSVTIWEEKGWHGGQANIAAQIEGRQEFLKFTDYLKAACRSLNVEIIYSKPANPLDVIEAVKTENFDRVVIATGKRALGFPLQTDGSISVVHAWDVITGKAATGMKTVVVGGNGQGIQTAMKLAKAGTIDGPTLKFLMQFQAESPEELFKLMNDGTKSVTVVEAGKGIGRDIGPSTRWSMLMLLKQLHIKTMEQTKVIDLRQGNIIVEKTTGDQSDAAVDQMSIPADTLVVAAGYMPNAELYAAIEGQIEGLCLIGDARKPGSMLDAVRSAYEEASVI